MRSEVDLRAKVDELRRRIHELPDPCEVGLGLVEHCNRYIAIAVMQAEIDTLDYVLEQQRRVQKKFPQT